MVTEQAPRSQLQTARVIAGALPAGVVMFWAAGWFLTGGGRNGLQPELLPPRLAFWVWAGVALCGFVGALAFRGRAVGVSAGSRSSDTPAGGAGYGAQVQTHLIVAWALLEGPALLAGVFFMFLGSRQILSAAAAVYALGVVLTFPRAEWFRHS